MIKQDRGREINTYVGNGKSARGFSDRSFFSWTSAWDVHATMFVSWGLEGLTEVSDCMSAGISGTKLPLWADSSFLNADVGRSLPRAVFRKETVFCTLPMCPGPALWPLALCCLSFKGFRVKATQKYRVI